MAGFCEGGNEPSGSTKLGKILDWKMNCQFYRTTVLGGLTCCVCIINVWIMLCVYRKCMDHAVCVSPSRTAKPLYQQSLSLLPTARLQFTRASLCYECWLSLKAYSLYFPALEKLTLPQLVKKFSMFYGTR